MGEDSRDAGTAVPWWQGAVIYQIYPRSFQDSNGDGVGDLAGIIRRLSYVAALGVDAVWLSPVFRSPMADFGYDVSDHCAIDPLFGTLAEMDALLARAHALGLRVLLDLVLPHTSDRHPWFAESRQSRTGPKADWYLWGDPKPDGTPPNNWQSVFAGPAWTWDAQRQQYYFHHFLPQQPQLNLHQAEVQEAQLAVARFWCARGVDGFRLDAINFAMGDPGLADNPPAPPGRPRTRPADYQLWRHNQAHPDIPAFLGRLRALCDDAGAGFLMGEVAGPDPRAALRAYTAGGRPLSSAYGFAFLHAPQLTPLTVAEALADWPSGDGSGWPSWAFSNHDAPRWVSRWAPEGPARAPFSRLVMALFLALRGNPILYQGEELGLTQVSVPFDRLRDPEAIANWPLSLGRDGARTPMPWEAAAPGLGFSAAEPWLPCGSDHAALAVDRQEADAASLLHLTRRLVAFRRGEPALRLGALGDIRAEGDLLSFVRTGPGADRLLCRFNFAPCLLAAGAAAPLAFGVNGADGSGWLPAFGAEICRL